MNNSDDLARQKRDHDEQIFRDHGAEMGHTQTPQAVADACANQLIHQYGLEGYPHVYSIVPAIMLKFFLPIFEQSYAARLLAQNEAMKSALEEMSKQRLTVEMLDEDRLYGDYENAYDHFIRQARAALNPPPTK